MPATIALTDRTEDTPIAGTPGPRIVTVETEAVAGLAAEHIVRSLATAVAARGVAHWATTGGPEPALVYRELLLPARRELVDWSAVHLWWGDDRFVPRDDPLSNVLALDTILLGDRGLPVPADHVHPFRHRSAAGETLDARASAAAMVSELVASGPACIGDWPSFDLVWLGIGGDGHLMSVFPGSDALDSSTWAMAVPAPTHIEPHVERVTMNPAIIGAARDVLVVAMGPHKADIVATLLGPIRDPRRWPAQLAAIEGAVWILDQQAAAVAR